MKRGKKTAKKGKIEVKGLSVTERDYRAFIAIILCVGLVALLFTGNFTGASTLGPLAGTAVGWYFSDKRGERNRP